MEIFVKKLSRAVNSFLFIFDCPTCGQECMSGKDAFCSACEWSEKPILDVSKAESVNIIAVPDEKRRRGPNKKTIRKLVQDQEGKCAYCFKELEYDIHIDHITPLCVGGFNSIDNFVASCARCNFIGGGKVFDDFWAKQSYIISKIMRRKRANH